MPLVGRSSNRDSGSDDGAETGCSTSPGIGGDLPAFGEPLPVRGRPQGFVVGDPAVEVESGLHVGVPESPRHHPVRGPRRATARSHGCAGTNAESTRPGRCVSACSARTLSRTVRLAQGRQQWRAASRLRSSGLVAVRLGYRIRLHGRPGGSSSQRTGVPSRRPHRPAGAASSSPGPRWGCPRGERSPRMGAAAADHEVVDPHAQASPSRIPVSASSANSESVTQVPLPLIRPRIVDRAAIQDRLDLFRQQQRRPVPALGAPHPHQRRRRRAPQRASK